MRHVSELVDVRIVDLVPGGQGIGDMPDGRNVFVWNALPGETVRVRVIKQKRSYCEAIAEEIVEAAPERIAPKEENYLATSPWQILRFEAENRYKNNIVTMLARQAHLSLAVNPVTIHDKRQWQYRNKMEYSFWGDETGLHLALYRRGSHGKQIVTGSQLAMPVLDVAANVLLMQLNQLNIRAGDLKTIVVRCDQQGRTVGALFVKPTTFPGLTLPAEFAGLRVYHSNPKSPASVTTSLLASYGDVLLRDRLAETELIYDVESFFQVNVPIFNQALRRIQTELRGNRLVDLYAGVGSIGLNAADEQVTLVELDPASAAMARQNAAVSRLDVTVVETSSEQALDYVTADQPVVVDPPRAGLHPKLTARLLAVRPPRLIYLSCNPATQMRDLAELRPAYDIAPIEVFNFFPRTPHIETLAILQSK